MLDTSILFPYIPFNFNRERNMIPLKESREGGSSYFRPGTLLLSSHFLSNRREAWQNYYTIGVEVTTPPIETRPHFLREYNSQRKLSHIAKTCPGVLSIWNDGIALYMLSPRGQGGCDMSQVSQDYPRGNFPGYYNTLFLNITIKYQQDNREIVLHGLVGWQTDYPHNPPKLYNKTKRGISNENPPDWKYYSSLGTSFYLSFTTFTT